MAVNDKKYYVMSYSSVGEGCPESLIGFFNCETFEWDPFELDPKRLDIKHQYCLKLSSLDMRIDELDFDFYQLGGEYVSRKFLSVCDDLGVSYKAIPLDLSWRGKVRKGEFFIFLPGESIAALDKERSVYEVSRDLESGRVLESSLYPGSAPIDNIDLFVVSAEVEGDLFRCQETLELFCSERFISYAGGLKGLSFLEVDENYKYDPWSEFDEL